MKGLSDTGITLLKDLVVVCYPLEVVYVDFIMHVTLLKGY